MDNLLTELFKQGVAGILMGVLVLFAWALLRRQMEDRESDLKWHREELERKRNEFLVAIAQQRADSIRVLTNLEEQFTRTLAVLEEQFRKAIESICERLERIEERLLAVLPAPGQREKPTRT